MRTPGQIARRNADFHTMLRLAMGLSLGVISSAGASPVDGVKAPGPAQMVLDPLVPGETQTGSVCNSGWMRCHAHAYATQTGHIQTYATPQGLGPADLQSAYNIDPNTVSG